MIKKRQTTFRNYHNLENFVNFFFQAGYLINAANCIKTFRSSLYFRREFPSDVKKREDDEYRKREDQVKNVRYI